MVRTYLGWMGFTPFYRELVVSLLAWIHHHRGWCWWLIKKIGYMEGSMWNFFHVLSNVSCFVYVKLMEDFLQNSPSIIWSSTYLVVGRLSRLWRTSFIGSFGCQWMSVYAWSRSWVIWSRHGQTLDNDPGRVILSWSPSQTIAQL